MNGNRTAPQELAVRTGLALASIATVAGLGALTVGRSNADPAPETPPEMLRYVAIGDSYSTGSNMPDPINPSCLRTASNYPHRIAKRFKNVDLHDMTCSAAQSRHASEPQLLHDGTYNPPQFDALNANTDVVTVSLGGGDGDLFGTLVNRCPAFTGPGTPCKDQLEREGIIPADIVKKMEKSMVHVLRGVKQRAPHAEVLVISYPVFAPKTDTCPQLPLAPGDYPFVRKTLKSFIRAQRHAANKTGVTFVDIEHLSMGHDICADEPWTAGKDGAPEKATPYHPYPVEQRAVANAIASYFK